MTDTSTASNATPASAPAAPQPFDPFNPEKVSQETHISDVFGFDPAEAEATLAGSGGEGGDSSPAAADPAPARGAETPPAGPSVGAEGGKEGAGSQAPAPSEPAAPQPPSDAQLELASLKATNAQLQERLAAVEAATKHPAQPQPGQDPAAQPQPAQPVKISLPQALRDDLISGEDDRMVGAIEQVVNALATSVQQLGAAILPRLAALEGKQPAGTTPAQTPAATPQPQPDAEAQVKQMRQQYFDKFPAHSKPEFQPIIAAVAGEMASQFPGHAWNDDYIAAMGARVTERARQLASLVSGGQASQPPSALPAANRSAAPTPGQKDLADEVADLFGVG